MQKLIDQPLNSRLTMHPSVTVFLSPAIEVWHRATSALNLIEPRVRANSLNCEDANERPRMQKATLIMQIRARCIIHISVPSWDIIPVIATGWHGIARNQRCYRYDCTDSRADDLCLDGPTCVSIARTASSQTFHDIAPRYRDDGVYVFDGIPDNDAVCSRLVPVLSVLSVLSKPNYRGVQLEPWTILDSAASGKWHLEIRETAWTDAI